MSSSSMFYDPSITSTNSEHLLNPLQCRYCGRQFRRLYSRVRHEPIHQSDKDELKHKCPYFKECGFSSLQKSNVTVHLNAYHYMVKHACTLSMDDGTLCTRDYRDKAALIRHEKLAHGYYRRSAKASAATKQKARNSLGQASQPSTTPATPAVDSYAHTRVPARKRLYAETEISIPDEHTRLRPRFESHSDIGFLTDSDTSDSSAGHDDYVAPNPMPAADFCDMWARSNNAIDRVLAAALGPRVRAATHPNGTVCALAFID